MNILPLPEPQAVKPIADPSVYCHWLLAIFLSPNQHCSWIFCNFALIFSFFSWESGCASLPPLASQYALASDQGNLCSTTVYVPWNVIIFETLNWILEHKFTFQWGIENIETIDNFFPLPKKISDWLEDYFRNTVNFRNSTKLWYKMALLNTELCLYII